jgi:hypothetical protein
MNLNIDWVALLLPLSVGVFFWFIGYRSHRTAESNEIEVIKLPKLIRWLFGKFHGNPCLNFRGVLMQLSAVFMWLPLGLGFSGIIPEQNAVNIFFVAGSVLACLGLVLVVREAKHRS